VYIFIYIYIYIFIYLCMYIYTHTYIYTRVVPQCKSRRKAKRRDRAQQYHYCFTLTILDIYVWLFSILFVFIPFSTLINEFVKNNPSLSLIHVKFSRVSLQFLLIISRVSRLCCGKYDTFVIVISINLKSIMRNDKFGEHRATLSAAMRRCNWRNNCSRF